MLTLPPPTSHPLQPLVRSVFGPMKTYYNRAIDSWMRAHPGRPVSIYKVRDLANSAFTQSMTPANITSGFRACGIYPPNKDIFTDADFMPAAVPDRPEPSSAVTDRPGSAEPNKPPEHCCTKIEVSVTPSQPQAGSSRGSTSRTTAHQIVPLPKATHRKPGRKRLSLKSAVLLLYKIKRAANWLGNLKSGREK